MYETLASRFPENSVNNSSMAQKKQVALMLPAEVRRLWDTEGAGYRPGVLGSAALAVFLRLDRAARYNLLEQAARMHNAETVSWAEMLKQAGDALAGRALGGDDPESPPRKGRGKKPKGK